MPVTPPALAVLAHRAANEASPSDAASDRLSLVVVALVVLAVVIAVVTVVFWRATRPEVHVPPEVTGPPHDTAATRHGGTHPDG